MATERNRVVHMMRLIAIIWVLTINVMVVDADCQTQNCSSHGVCTELQDDYECECQYFYFGKDCERFLSIPLVIGQQGPIATGDKVNLTCLPADDLSSVRVVWTFIAKGTSRVLQLTTARSYIMENIGETNSGEYYCYAITEYGSTMESINLEVLGVQTDGVTKKSDARSQHAPAGIIVGGVLASIMSVAGAVGVA